MTNREIDVLIAEKVFGAKVEFLDQKHGWRIDYTTDKEECNDPIRTDYGNDGYRLKNYSTNLAFAWEVVDYFDKNGGAITYSSMKNGGRGHFLILSYLENSSSSRLDYVSVIGDSVPQAICKAALLTKDIEI